MYVVFYVVRCMKKRRSSASMRFSTLIEISSRHISLHTDTLIINPAPTARGVVHRDFSNHSEQMMPILSNPSNFLQHF